MAGKVERTRQRWEVRKAQAMVGALRDPNFKPKPQMAAGWYDDPRGGGGGKAFWDGYTWDFSLDHAEWLAREEQKRRDVQYGLKIGVGILAGIAVAKAINGFADGAHGWKLAEWANNNGVQL